MPKQNKELEQSRRHVADRLFNSEPEQTANTVFAHIANGSDMITLAETMDVRYSDLAHFMQSTPERKELLRQAYQARNEWCQKKILREVERLSMVDIRELYDENGVLKDVHEWSDHAAAAVLSIETDEIFERDGKTVAHIGNKKKLKLADKLKALELLGRGHGLFANKIEVSGKVTHEQFMDSTYPPEEK